MRDRFNTVDVWRRAGYSPAQLGEIAAQVLNSDAMRAFRSRLFTRIVPVLKDIGLFGPKMQKALGDMGVLGFAAVDAKKMLADDARVADDFDRRRFVQQQIGAEPLRNA